MKFAIVALLLAVTVEGQRASRALFLENDTIVIQEKGAPHGADCITFANNGDTVTALCATDHADRQVVKAKLNGRQVIFIQRKFPAGFRDDLVRKNACLGFNGSYFKALDCATGGDFARLDRQRVMARSGACIKGHTGNGLTTVDVTGKKCATYTSISVARSDTI